VRYYWHVVALWCCGGKISTCTNPLNDRSPEHDIILESCAKINSRLEIPHTTYAVQCNTVSNSNTIANMYITLFQNFSSSLQNMSPKTMGLQAPPSPRPIRLWIFAYTKYRAHLLKVMINSHNVQLPVGLRAQMIELCTSTVDVWIFNVFSSHLLNNIQNCMITSTLCITPKFKYVKVTHISYTSTSSTGYHELT